MKALLKCISLFVLLITVWTITVFHRGVFPKPAPEKLVRTEQAKATWISKEEAGIHQLVLEGSPYERGYLAGRHTQQLLRLQEQSLHDKLTELIPSRFVRGALRVFLMRWYWGAEKYFEEWMSEEMFGVGEWAPKEFDFLADGFTRQAAYHGLHEVGQMMVDRGFEDMGCTVVATPLKGGWIVGRNFDFEGGRVFDLEKIMKWVFPDEGFAYVSVIWAGMVGAVTGVNERGVYISLNAAGSDDFRRHGTPSTLVLLKALQFAKSAREAVEILRNETMFITDIFVVTDQNNQTLYRVEKSPQRTEVLEHREPLAVTNHLIAPAWAGDSVNESRKKELTTLHRSTRAEELLRRLGSGPARSASEVNLQLLSIMRDKGEEAGRPLHLGNRRAIDSLIATHAVVYNAIENRLYVSQGPALTSKLIGFDLEESFRARMPLRKGELPADTAVTPERYFAVKDSIQLVASASRLLRKNRCGESRALLNKAGRLDPDSSMFAEALGDLAACEGDANGARVHWQKALELVPAYVRQKENLLEKLK